MNFTIWLQESISKRNSLKAWLSKIQHFFTVLDFQSGWKKPLTFHLGLDFLLKIAREHESLQFNSSKRLRFSRSSVSSRGGSASMCKNSAGKHRSPWTLIGWGEHLCCTRWCCPNLGSLQKGNPPLILRVYSCLGITGSTQMLQENILGDAFLPNSCYENLPRRKHHKPNWWNRVKWFDRNPLVVWFSLWYQGEVWNPLVVSCCTLSHEIIGLSLFLHTNFPRFLFECSLTTLK